MKLAAGAALVLVLLVGCGNRGGVAQESLADVDRSAEYWTFRSTCDGGRIEVEFGAERVAALGLGYASNEEFAVECGDPERVAVSDEELRDRTPTGAELTQPSHEPKTLSCRADGTLLVEAHPVWGNEGVVGAALRFERAGVTILQGAVLREGYFSPPSVVQWLDGVCRPV